MQDLSMPTFEYKIKVLFAIAKSRLCHTERDIIKALEHIKFAKDISMKRNYCRLKTILEAEQVLHLRHTKSPSLEEEVSECASTVSQSNRQA